MERGKGQEKIKIDVCFYDEWRLDFFAVPGQFSVF